MFLSFQSRSTVSPSASRVTSLCRFAIWLTDWVSYKPFSNNIYTSKNRSLLKKMLVFFSVNSEVNARRVANVEQCFGKMAKPLNLFGRVLVGEGVLVKMCRYEDSNCDILFFAQIHQRFYYSLSMAEAVFR